MHIVLQVWGGLFYLLNKIFMSATERTVGEISRKWRVRSWAIYLWGLPPWLVIFAQERAWIVFCVETAGALSMVLGLVIARSRTGKAPMWLNHVALVGAVVGLASSLYDFAGLTTLNQGIELVSMAGFIVGTYLLANKKPTGYLWYLLMNTTMGWLLARQGYWLLVIQQILSVAFIADAWMVWRRKSQTFIAIPAVSSE